MTNDEVAGQADSTERPPCYNCGEPYAPDDIARHTEPVTCGRCPNCNTMPACYTCRIMYCACVEHQHG